ncbi:MAG: tRNA pseudouridine(13) synthase TruD, partial [Planctomycetota bacterium]
MDLPLLTTDLPGTGGIVRATPEDFLVEEIPLYPAMGAGDHSYALVEKRGITTREAIRRLAQHLDVPERSVGCAGLKDARAVARQTFSVEHMEPRRLEGLELQDLRVLSVKRHRNKLKTGHLAGNRFVLRIRETSDGALEAARAVLAVLEARGLPNAFGPQRFGTRGDTHLVGRALLAGDFEEMLALLLGRPSELENDPRVLEARRRYDDGDGQGALDVLPRSFHVERRVLSRLLEGNSPQRAVGSIPKPLRRLYVSAF